MSALRLRKPSSLLLGGPGLRPVVRFNPALGGRSGAWLTRNRSWLVDRLQSTSTAHPVSRARGDQSGRDDDADNLHVPCSLAVAN